MVDFEALPPELGYMEVRREFYQRISEAIPAEKRAEVENLINTMIRMDEYLCEYYGLDRT